MNPSETPSSQPRQGSPALLELAALVLAAFIAIVALNSVSKGPETRFEDLALGTATSSHFAKIGEHPIHCRNLADADGCIRGVRARGGEKVALWLGNSQLHAVNQMKGGDETASATLFRRLRADGIELLTFSQPNANLQEHLVLFTHLKRDLPVEWLVLPVVFDDLRETGIRAQLAPALDDPETVMTLSASEVGRQIVARNGEVAADDMAALDETVQESVEASLNDWLEHHIELWAVRPQLRGQLMSSLYQLRNTALGITSQSKRKVIRGRYEMNMAALNAILAEASRSGIRSVVYVVPLRNDVDTPYDADEYARFQAEAEDLARHNGAVFANFETIVPGELWGMKLTERSGGAELDFMHFRAAGHALLAGALGDLLEAEIPRKSPVIFNSVTFLLFLAIAVGLYWLLPRRPRLWMLFLASLTFYGFWRVEFLPVMLASTLVDYVAARTIHDSEDPRRRRFFLGLSLFVNLGLLFYFKYLIFFASNSVGLLRAIGLDVADPGWSIILPLGISFYTFQTISYTVDVYRRLIEPQREFVLYACYVTFFPQLVAGPILRAREVIGQLSTRASFQIGDFALGLRRIVFGLFLKVVLADNLAPLVDDGFALPVDALGALDVWTLAFLFGFQIYFDFSAYSHIALGSARLMGIHFPENFNFPYVATSPRDFWRRWHISLSSWIRDYLYLPLMGEAVRDDSRGGLAAAVDDRRERRRTRSLFLTWAIMGLWHGANWTFVLWGVYHAALVFAHRIVAPRLPSLPPAPQAVAGWAVTLPLAMLGWIPFRAQSVGDALRMLSTVVDPTKYFSLGMRENNYLVAALIMLAIAVTYGLRNFAVPRLSQRPVVWTLAQAGGYSVVIALVFVFLRPINQFIYFQF